MAFRDLFKSLLAQQYAGAGFSGFGGNMPSQQSLDNMNMAKANGGGGGGGMKINPLQVAMGVAQSGVNIADAVMQPKFDYGQENYTAEQAGQAEGDRARKLPMQQVAQYLLLVGYLVAFLVL